MTSRQSDTLFPKGLSEYFLNPQAPRHRQYEAIRAIALDKRSVEDVAKEFSYKPSTLYSLLRDVKAGKVELFPSVPKGPTQKRTPPEVVKEIIALRRQLLSTPDIQARLEKEGTTISARTVERVLKDAGFGRLKRRTNKELGRTVSNKAIPMRAEVPNYKDLEKFTVDCPSVGVFFFLPYIIESGVIDLLRDDNMPGSRDIGATQACLSMLLLKLIGQKRLSHIGAYDQEPGFGVFAGLNVLPKPTYMNTWSCRSSERELIQAQRKIIERFQEKYSDFYQSDYINLDFHSIPHYGDKPEMEKVWCGSKGKTLRGANTVIACDSRSNAIIYTRADILRKEEAGEVKKFVKYWKKIRKNVSETLVFDCKFTSYTVLDSLDKDSISFITLRKRNASLLKEIEKLPKGMWEKAHIPIPKRKYKNVSVYESEVNLKQCESSFRQIVVKGHGREKPTFILTNNKELSLAKVLEVYAQRWRVENKIAELISFFNLNALSSPVMIRIHFDILWSMIADTLYHRFAKDLRRFEKNLAPTIFRKFIDMPGKVVYDGDNFQIKIRKRGHTPILKGLQKLEKPFAVPWLDGKTIEIIWTA